VDQKNKDIDSLIVASLSRQISESGEKQLDQWIKEAPENLEQWELIQKVWIERSQDRKIINADDVLENIWSKAYNISSSKRGKTFSIGMFVKVAAAFLILFAATFLLVEYPKLPVEGTNTGANLIIKGNPAGQKSKIILSDGSVVWLNSASSVSYLEKFSEVARNITLDGEAYFEVAPDQSRPFVVTTGEITTTALGTSFNINAFDPDNIKIALITGKAKVVNKIYKDDPYLLKPGMGLVFSGNEEAYGYNFDVEKISQWRNGNLIFDGENFSEFKEIIERWYGITVNVKGNIPKGWSIKGQFENESLVNVMESVSFNKKFDYLLKGKEITINF
jgi:transmembrane sensor